MKKLHCILIVLMMCFVGCEKKKTSSSAEIPLENEILQNLEEPLSNDENAKHAHNLYKKCIACHGAKGNRIAPGSANKILLSNLSKDEIVSALKGYRARTLSKGGTSAIMYLETQGFSDEDIEALGEYIASF